MKKVSGAGTTVFVYNVRGQLVAEYSNAPQPAQSTRTSYLSYDALGSTRLVTGQNQEVKTRADYLPFGGELNIGRSGYEAGSVRQKFTGYERDDESQLDFAQARYYSPSAGRFNSFDSQVTKAALTTPQGWNRYAYSLNNPMSVTDPTGLVWLTNDDRNYQWVPDDEYDPEQWEGYHMALPGTVVYFGEGWGGYETKYANLMGGFVTLEADGSLSPAPPPLNFNITPQAAEGTTAGQSTLLVPLQPDPNGIGSIGASEQATGPGTIRDAIYMGVTPILLIRLAAAYPTVRDIRQEGHRRFPGEANSDRRHQWASEQVALMYGEGLARMYGGLNEVQGLAWHDVWNLRSRMRGETPWAFQFSDLKNNEKGIDRASNKLGWW